MRMHGIIKPAILSGRSGLGRVSEWELGVSEYSQAIRLVMSEICTMIFLLMATKMILQRRRSWTIGFLRLAILKMRLCSGWHWLRLSISVLQENGFEWLDSIVTQAGLAEALCQLDTTRCGKILWNDAMKIAPYLCSEQYELARKVISTIIELYDAAIESHREWMKKEELEAYVKRYQDDHEKFIELLEIVCKHDFVKIQEYLENNYTLNSSYAEFCRTNVNDFRV